MVWVPNRMAQWILLTQLAWVQPSQPLYGACLERCVTEGCNNCKVMTARLAHDSGDIRGTVFFLPGRSGILLAREPSLHQFYNLGFNVYTLDWRGQGESSRTLEDSHKVHIEAFESYLEDLCALKLRARVDKAPQPWLLVGSSMGGHMALRLMEEAPDGLDGAILVAPMLDVHTGFIPRSVAPMVAAMLRKLGLGERYAPGYGPYDLAGDRFEGNQSTRDPARYAEQKRFLREHPEYVTGGVTVSWADEVFKSMDRANAPGRLAKVTAPVLMLNAGDDRVVDSSAAHVVAERLPHCREVVIPGARHNLFAETDDAQAIVWGEINLFLDQVAPADSSKAAAG